MAAACGAPAIGVPRPREVLAPEAPLSSACVGDGNLIRLAAHDEGAPVVVLREDEVGLDKVGTLLMWADGTVAVDELSMKPFAPRAVRVAPAEVEALRLRLLDAMAGKPRQVELRLRDPDGGRVMGASLHGPVTSVVVRDPDGWRVAVVRGIWRDDVLAPSRRREEMIATFKAQRFAPPPSSGNVNLDRLLSALHIPDPPPPWFMALYRVLLDARPPGGEPLAPYTFRLALVVDYGDHEHRGPRFGASTRWPADLPVPPPELTPAFCADPDHDCLFDLAPGHLDAARRLRAVLRDDTGRPRPVEHGSHRWIVRLDERYRGQPVIHRVLQCVDDLDEQNPYDD